MREREERENEKVREEKIERKGREREKVRERKKRK